MVLQVREQDKARVIQRLIKEASPRRVFLLLVIVATVITAIGLLNDSASLVIGGMLVAPLLSPVLGIAMGVVTADTRLIKFASWTILISVGIVILTSMIIAWFHAPVVLTDEIMERTNVLFMLPVAIAAGVAAVLALVHRERLVALPGVAVSVAILPPLSVLGIGIATLNGMLIQKSLGVFAVNLIGIIFACIIMFSMMGFATKRLQAERALDREQGVLNSHERK